MPEPDETGAPADAAAWAEALDVLESRAAQADGSAPLDPWDSVVSLRALSMAALPAALAGRAREVQAAQQRAIDELRDRQLAVRAQLESLSGVRAPHSDGEPPLYVDLIG